MVNVDGFYGELFEEVSRRYNIGRIKGEPVHEKMGCVNHNFAVETGDGVYMVRYQPTIYPWSLKRKSLEYGVTDFLHESDFELETPFYLPNDAGEKATLIDDKMIEVYKRVPGVSAPDAPWSVDDLIVAAAKYHNAVRGYKIDEASVKAKENYDSEGKLSGSIDVCITKAILQRTIEDKIIFQNAGLLLDAYDYAMAVGHPNKPDSVAHGDIHPGNVTYLNDVLHGLIDFGNVKESSKDGDLCKFVDCDADEFSRRKEIYRSVGELSDAEERELVPRAIIHKLNAINWAYNFFDKSPEKRPKMLNDMTRKLRKIVKYHTDVSVGPVPEFEL